MKSLEEILEKRILNFGPISISDFMIDSNQHPKFGYYNNYFPFGKKGDFITSPEISQMFGELIGLWIIDFWKLIGEPNKFNILELGPGSGVLIADVWRVIKQNDKCKNSCKKVLLFESSQKLKKIQKKNLKNSIGTENIEWINNLNTKNKTPFILLANEFFDALPIKQIQLTNDGWRERLIGYDSKKNLFYFTLSNRPTLLEKFIPKKLKGFRIGQIFEIPTQMIIILNEVFKQIEKSESSILLFDYKKEKKVGNSLKSIKHHQIINPLESPGKSDLSVHIDFDLIKEMSKDYKINSHGPIAQNKFLINLGILERARMLKKNATEHQNNQINFGLDLLLNKKKMGDIFNVMSLTNTKIKKVAGF